MSSSTPYLHPDWVILLGTRAVVSGVASLMILVGTWQADRAWDDKEVRTEPDGILEYRSMSSTVASATVVSNTNTADNNNNNTWGERLRLIRAAAWKGPSASSLGVAGMGWILLLISFLLDAHEYTGWINMKMIMGSGGDSSSGDSDALLAGISLAALILAVVFVATVQTLVLPAAVQGRCVHEHASFLATSLLGGWLVLGILVALTGGGGRGRSNSNSSSSSNAEQSSSSSSSSSWRSSSSLGIILTPILASILIATAPFVLWSSRKRGSSYDKGGPANIRPVLYNAAGPATVTGWWLFWVAHNAVHASPRSFYVPVYCTIRTAVAFTGATLVVLVQYLAGYAHDEAPQVNDHFVTDYYNYNNKYFVGGGGDNDNNTDNMSEAVVVVVVETPAFGLDVPTKNGSTHKRSYFFGSANEMKFAFCVAWGVMATAAFLPAFCKAGIAQPVVLFLVICVLGVVAALRHERGIRAADNAEFEKWTFVEGWVIVAAAALFLWQDGVAAGILAALGALCILAGEMLLHHDRKRGKFWMDGGGEREREGCGSSHCGFTVLSYGTLLFPAGMIFLAWGLSIP